VRGAKVPIQGKDLIVLSPISHLRVVDGKVWRSFVVENVQESRLRPIRNSKLYSSDLHDSIQLAGKACDHLRQLIAFKAFKGLLFGTK
jgi:hypothetical protein